MHVGITGRRVAVPNSLHSVVTTYGGRVFRISPREKLARQGRTLKDMWKDRRRR
jgi:hypothetical protein